MINSIMILILGGLFLVIPIPSIRFVLTLFLFIRIWSSLSRKMIPHFIEIVGPKEPHYAHSNSPFQVEIQIKNRSPLPLSYFSLSQNPGELTSLDQQKKILSLAPFEEKKVSFSLMGKERGHYTLKSPTVEGMDPFRISSWKKSCDAAQKIMIFPELFDVELLHKRGTGGGSINVSSCLYEDMTRFRSLREYVPGDELRRINWKVSARLGKLHTMEYHNTVDSPVHIILNLSANEYPLTHRKVLMERAIRVASSLGIYFISKGQRISFLSSGFVPSERDSSVLFLEKGQGKEQSARLLKILAGIRGNQKGISLIELLSLEENPQQWGTKNLIIGPPPLTEDSNFLYNQVKSGRDIEYFMITARTSKDSPMNRRGVL